MNYIQFGDDSKFGPEEKALIEYFGEDNYTPFYKKHIVQNKLRITKDDFIIGDIPAMLAALRQLGIEYIYCDYPECLKEHLHRKVWTGTMKDIRNKLFEDGQIDPVFIKPREKLKKFTGFVLTCIDDLQFTNHAGNSTKIYCSEPVVWLSEFRCPVINGIVRGMFRVPYTCHDADATPNIKDVQKIADDFENSPKAYCLDVGVLSSGETALIEVNDGFSIGKYDMPNDLYAELVITRWKDLMSTVKI